ncbi:transcription factor [Ganoderma sinense ZZ0214-1]|uniref:Transcription factor n=1 Tax=Ganoderma sinense ZZ0214-1 TaxID=1077348 RepID=A0A2G8SN62_9APHY|nr:transcription factor [Ganoderma sinense ZZ0214-1]
MLIAFISLSAEIASKRDPTVEACDYDAAPKRRGRDKVPGSREILHGFDPATFDPENVAIYELPARPPCNPSEDEDTTRKEKERSVYDLIADVPSMQFARETWWDALLEFYATDGAIGGMTLTADQRLATTKRVFADIRAVLNASMYWASFLHLPRFFETFLDPKRRSSVQPSLILSMLAIGVHAQSSEIMHGAKGRARAQKLIDLADSAIKASLSTNWVDIGLVQAAWFITYFEMQGHAQQQSYRCEGSIQLLDSLIRLLSLTTLDADRLEAHYSIFATSSSNIVGQSMFNDPAGAHADAHPPAPSERNRALENVVIPKPGASIEGPAQCDCLKYTLKEQWPTVSEVAPLWEMTTMWPNGLMEGEIRKEECRRLVWSSVMLSAGQNAYAAADGELDRTELFIKDYRNLAILFPGEDIMFSSNGQISPSNVWTLCIRSMMLWHTSTRQRGNTALSPQARAEYSINAWLEADAIEAALDMHTCQLEGAQLYQTREFLFALYAPQVTSLGIMSYYREKAESWLRIQMQVSEYLWKASQEEEKWEMMNRPLLSYWFMGHIVRALLLYKSDPTLLIALDAVKMHIKPLEFLMRLWPYDDQRQKWASLRREVVQTCLKAGVPPPPTDVPIPFDRVRRKTFPSLPAPQT